MSKDSMRIEWWDIDRVIPYKNNPRHNDDAVEKVANSLREFGWKQSLVVDSDGVLIVGHTRLKAAKSLGMDKVPVLVANDLTPAQVQAYRIADNASGGIAEWDFDLLAVEVDGLQVDFDMEDFGVDMSKLDFSFGDAPEIVNSSKEIDVSSFDDDKFEHECPRCGFRFNE